MIHRYSLFFSLSISLPATALGVVLETAPLPLGTLRLETAGKTTLQWMTLGHQREVILTTTGKNPLGKAVYIRLKYPDTPYWNSFLKECKRNMENLTEKNFVDVGPVEYQGQTLTRQNFTTHSIDQWRSWYENKKTSLLGLHLNPSCHTQHH